MKSMTKQQIAACAGVDVRTLMVWLAPHKQKLISMGMPHGKGALPPNVVQWIATYFCIDIPP